MGRIIREPWKLNSSWGTVLALTGCSFGLKVDDRCHCLYCKFRCMKSAAPTEESKLGHLLCPRECEYEGLKPNETSSGQAGNLVPTKEMP